MAAGVIRLLMDGQQPARVPDAVIDGIREREVGGIVRLPRPQPFRSGDRVRVVRGPFEGHFGLYDGMAPRERIFVLLSMLGASIRTEMAEADVVRTARSTSPGPGSQILCSAACTRAANVTRIAGCSWRAAAAME
jgi:transcription antitermination factor NusG